MWVASCRTASAIEGCEIGSRPSPRRSVGHEPVHEIWSSLPTKKVHASVKQPQPTNRPQTRRTTAFLQRKERIYELIIEKTQRGQFRLKNAEIMAITGFSK